MKYFKEIKGNQTVVEFELRNNGVINVTRGILDKVEKNYSITGSHIDEICSILHNYPKYAPYTEIDNYIKNDNNREVAKKYAYINHLRSSIQFLGEDIPEGFGFNNEGIYYINNNLNTTDNLSTTSRIANHILESKKYSAKQVLQALNYIQSDLIDIPRDWSFAGSVQEIPESIEFNNHDYLSYKKTYHKIYKIIIENYITIFGAGTYSNELKRFIIDDFLTLYIKSSYDNINAGNRDEIIYFIQEYLEKNDFLYTDKSISLQSQIPKILSVMEKMSQTIKHKWYGNLKEVYQYILSKKGCKKAIVPDFELESYYSIPSELEINVGMIQCSGIIMNHAEELAEKLYQIKKNSGFLNKMFNSNNDIKNKARYINDISKILRQFLEKYKNDHHVLFIGFEETETHKVLKDNGIVSNSWEKEFHNKLSSIIEHIFNRNSKNKTINYIPSKKFNIENLRIGKLSGDDFADTIKHSIVQCIERKNTANTDYEIKTINNDFFNRVNIFYYDLIREGGIVLSNSKVIKDEDLIFDLPEYIISFADQHFNSFASLETLNVKLNISLFAD